MWMQYPEDPPFRISGGATVWHLDKLYLIGGYSVEYDCELKSFYQSPVTSVWIFDPSVGKWTMGPPLPKESFVTKNKTIRFRGYSLGEIQVCFVKIELNHHICSLQEQPRVMQVTSTTAEAVPWP